MRKFNAKQSKGTMLSVTKTSTSNDEDGRNLFQNNKKCFAELRQIYKKMFLKWKIEPERAVKPVTGGWNSEKSSKDALLLRIYEKPRRISDIEKTIL
jgi:hypothetical protein